MRPLTMSCSFVLLVCLPDRNSSLFRSLCLTVWCTSVLELRTSHWKHSMLPPCYLEACQHRNYIWLCSPENHRGFHVVFYWCKGVQLFPSFTHWWILFFPLFQSALSNLPWSASRMALARVERSHHYYISSRPCKVLTLQKRPTTGMLPPVADNEEVKF